MFIIWNPDSKLPPTKKFSSFDVASRVADKMLLSSPDAVFHIMELRSTRSEAVLFEIAADLEGLSTD